MGEKYIYRFLNYLTIDYKALEMYLEEMAQKGYELESIGALGRGKFRVIQPRHIQYCVEVLDNERIEEYKNLYEALGWQEIKTGNYIRIYKAREGVEALPIHTYGEIKKNQVIKTIFKREGWMILFSILWFILGIRELITMNYYDLLDNMFLQSVFIKLLIGGIYTFYSICLVVFITKTLRKEGYRPTLKGAKCRSNVYYGVTLIFLLIIFNMIGGGEINPLLLLPLLAMIGAVIVMAILYKKYYYNVPNKTNNKKVWVNLLYGIGIVASVWGTFMLSMALVVRTPYERPELEEELAEAKVVGAMSIKDFPGYEDIQIEEVSIDSGESFALNKYYDYSEDYEHMRFDVAYYDCKNEKFTQMVWEKLYDRHSDETIAYGALEKTYEDYFGADEAYKHQNWNELLLRKGDTILFIDSEALDFFDKANAEIIKKTLEQ